LKNGIQSFLLGNLEQAEEAWQDGIRHDWLSVALRNNLAVCRMRRENWTQAAEDLRKARTLDISHPRVVGTLAFCLAQLGSSDEAEKLGREVVTMRPDLVSGRIVLSNLALKNGMLDMALYHASGAIAWNPLSHSARWQHIGLLEKSGLTVEADAERGELDKLGTDVPLAEFLIDDMREPPWGKIRREEPPFPNDDSGDWNSGGAGSGIPRRPRDPKPSGVEEISTSDYRGGFPEGSSGEF
jgi:tetratricopeptide (TPR) repeat protein